MHTEMKLSLLMGWEVAGYLLRRAVRLPDMCDKRVTTFFSAYAGYCYTFFGSSCKNKVFFVVVEKVAIHRKIKHIKVI